MHIYKSLLTYCVLLFIFMIIFNIQKNFLLVFITIIKRLFFHFVITLGGINISDEGAKALAEALKLNKNLTSLSLSKSLLL